MGQLMNLQNASNFVKKTLYLQRQLKYSPTINLGLPKNSKQQSMKRKLLLTQKTESKLIQAKLNKQIKKAKRVYKEKVEKLFQDGNATEENNRVL
jgi:hypothetical protein